jgi:hypothetical protein
MRPSSQRQDPPPVRGAPAPLIIRERVRATQAAKDVVARRCDRSRSALRYRGRHNCLQVRSNLWATVRSSMIWASLGTLTKPFSDPSNGKAIQSATDSSRVDLGGGPRSVFAAFLILRSRLFVVATKKKPSCCARRSRAGSFSRRAGGPGPACSGWLFRRRRISCQFADFIGDGRVRFCPTCQKFLGLVRWATAVREGAGRE